MRKDNAGQISLEYMLIVAVSLILLLIFTLPLTQQATGEVMDISDVLNVKSDLSKIAHAIEKVYGQGQGSKQTVNIISSKDYKVNVAGNSIFCNLKLKDGTYKQVKVGCKSNLEKTGFYIHEDENSITVSWPVDSDKMQVYSG